MHEIFFNRYSQYAKEYASVFTLLNSSRAYEMDAEVTGLGQLVQKLEQKAITYDDPVQGLIKTYTHVPFALGFRVTHELYKDDLYNVIKRMPQCLSRSAHQTMEVQHWNVFNNAFNTAVTGLDGKALCVTDHPNVSGAGGPYANALSTAADLSVTSLESMIELMENTTDDKDLNLMIKGKTLVIPVHLKWVAREILHSEKKPGTADNEINPLGDEDLSYMVSHYLSSTSAWFLLANKEDHYLRSFMREALIFDNDDDFDTGDALFQCYTRFSVGFSGWRGICGTAGVGLI
jgi:phage major head subunit gpT-like protein